VTTGRRAARPNRTQALPAHRPRDAPSESSGVNEPHIQTPITSVSSPTYHVVGLLTEKPEILAISRELASAGVDVAAVEILCGERGAAILDVAVRRVTPAIHGHSWRNPHCY
jgi:hypothetical protein